MSDSRGDKAGEDVVEAINTAWDKLYGGEPVSDPKALCNRIRAIAGDVECGRVNFRVTNAAYVKADKELRELRCALSSGGGTNAAPQELKTAAGLEVAAVVGRVIGPAADGEAPAGAATGDCEGGIACSASGAPAAWRYKLPGADYWLLSMGKPDMPRDWPCDPLYLAPSASGYSEADVDVMLDMVREQGHCATNKDIIAHFDNSSDRRGA